MEILSLIGLCGIIYLALTCGKDEIEKPLLTIGIVGFSRKQRKTIKSLQTIYWEIADRHNDVSIRRNLASYFSSILLKLQSSESWRQIEKDFPYSPYVIALFFVRNQESLHGEAHNKLIFSGELSQEHMRLLQRELIPT